MLSWTVSLSHFIYFNSSLVKFLEFWDTLGNKAPQKLPLSPMFTKISPGNFNVPSRNSVLSGLEILGESYPHLCDMRNNGARHLIMSVIPLTAEVKNFDTVCLTIPITWLVLITMS